MFGFYKTFKDGFAKTVSAISKQTAGIFGGRRLDVDSLDELEEALYTADFGVETTAEILAEIKQAYAADKELQGRQAAEIRAAGLRRALAGAEGPRVGRAADAAGASPRPALAGAEGTLVAAAQKPTVIAMIGVNGWARRPRRRN